MRRTVLIAVAALAAAGSVSAQQEPSDPGRGGKVGVDLVAAPALGFGVPIRLTKNLTLRTTVGFGSAATGAAAWSLGSDLRYTLRPDADWSAYLSGQASYLHAPNPSGYRSTASGADSLALSGNGGLFSAGLGLRRSLGRQTSVYGELRYGRLTATGVYDSWGMWRVNGLNTVSFALGATFGLR
ncbi:MAG: hypothetical protein ACM3PV_16800 [Betaproteobacteria bacterium]